MHVDLCKHSSYVSCIKIKGIPILPPLITDEKRKEIEYLRQRAIEVENRIKKCNEKKRVICDASKDEPVLTEKFEHTNTLEHQLAFHDEHLHKTYTNANDSLAESCSFNEYCPNLSYVHKPDGSNIAPVFEYTSPSTTSESSATEEDNQVPKLTRSNSYVLESPSPLLLAYLKKQQESNVTTSQTGQEQYTSTPVRAKSKASKESVIMKEVIENNFTDTTSSEQVDIESQLKQILNNIPETYSREILAIFEKVTASNRKLDYGEEEVDVERKRCISEGSNAYMSPICMEANSISFMTSSQTLYFSVNSSDEALNTIAARPNILATNMELIGASKSPLTAKSKVNNKKELAASKITAAVKGYFVRRLMRTEKVQNLISTIKDTIMYAMDLQRDNDLQPSDVELHRRYLQQVTAACFAFYEIFFELSTSERMSIIAQDRQKKIEKMKRSLTLGNSRPNSSSASRPNSSTSRPKSMIKKHSRTVKV